jgi:hypothetical protein
MAHETSNYMHNFQSVTQIRNGKSDYVTDQLQSDNLLIRRTPSLINSQSEQRSHQLAAVFVDVLGPRPGSCKRKHLQQDSTVPGGIATKYMKIKSVIIIVGTTIKPRSTSNESASVTERPHVGQRLTQ